MRSLLIIPGLLILSYFSAGAQEKPVRLEIDAGISVGEMRPIYAFFGYDEPNYSYRENGRKLLAEIADLSPVPVYVRTHNLLTSKEGEPDLKWGFTNVYTEDSRGNPVYDWTLLDSILNAQTDNGLLPLVELGFMPKALSTQPEPYRHEWSSKGPLWTGWTFPPKDYDKWAELIYQLVLHQKEVHGEKEIEKWIWEVWNEPDIGYWSGTFEEFCKLYDYGIDAVKRACPGCTVGGPHTTGPAGKSGNEYLYRFLDHCVNGTNYRTGKKGSPLDYISFHAKGNPEMVDGHIRMNMGTQLNDIAKGFEAVKSFPELKDLPIIIGECDPEGCAACSWKRDPKYGYRNGTVYPSYTASSFARIYELMDEYEVNLRGALTWAFEFEDQEWFAGFRELATNGVDKPVMNVFRMLGMMRGNRVLVKGNPYPARKVIEQGIRDLPDINAMACADRNEMTILVWNYHDDDILGEINDIDLTISNIPDGSMLMHHYRVDQELSNSYNVWQKSGSPHEPSEEEYRTLEAAGHLKLLTSPQWITASDNQTNIKFSLPRQGVSLIKLEW
ncbi:MAG: beta-xylosidase [Bacteroidales bacterium]|nr:beta-xylosidase [Bacteroidales bacterium]